MNKQPLIHVQLPANANLKKSDIDKISSMRGIRYYAIKKDCFSFHGERYFKVDFTKKIVVNVCVHSGEIKKGRPYVYGAYIIAYNSFIGNYFWDKGRYVDEITNALFEEKFNEVTNRLKTLI